MRWLVVAKNTESGKLEIITPDMEVDASDPRYGNEVHIVPFKEEPDPQRFNFGVHDLIQGCYCHPKIEPHRGGRTVISHSAVVN